MIANQSFSKLIINFGIYNTQVLKNRIFVSFSIKILGRFLNEG